MNDNILGGIEGNNSFQNGETLFFWPMKSSVDNSSQNSAGRKPPVGKHCRIVIHFKLWSGRIPLHMKCITLTGKVCARLHSWGIITVSVGRTSRLALALSCWTFKKHFRSSSTSFLSPRRSPDHSSPILMQDNDKSARCTQIVMFDSGWHGRFLNPRVECLSFPCCSSTGEVVPWLWWREDAPACTQLEWTLPGVAAMYLHCTK